MKKLLSFLCVLTLPLALTACAFRPAAGEKEPARMSTEPEPLSLRVNTCRFTNQTADAPASATAEWFTLTPGVSDNLPPALAETLSALAREWDGDCRQEALNISESAQEYLQEPWATPGMEYSFSYLPYVTRADTVAMGVRSEYYSFTGGAHGYYGSFCYNFDSQTGCELALEDLVTDTGTLTEILKAALRQEYAEYALDAAESYFSNFLEGKYSLNWCFENEGVAFFFNPYDLGSYAEGRQVIHLRFADYPELFNPAYTVLSPRRAVPFTPDAVLPCDVGGDGTADTVQILSVPEEEGYYYRFGVSLNGRELFPEYGDGYSEESYLLYDHGKYFVYLFVTSDNDYVNLFVIDLASFTCSGSVNAYDALLDSDFGPEFTSFTTTALTDPAEMLFASRVSVLGTWSGIKTYSAAENGFPVSADPDYAVTAMEGKELVNAVPFSGLLQTPEGGTGEKVTVPAGTTLRLARTDGHSYAVLELADGRLVRTPYDRTAWPYLLDGVDESLVFNFLPYAG